VKPWYEAFRFGLSDLGYSEGKSIAIEHRSADGQADRLPALATELASLQPKIIVASGSSAAIAARNATETIPIVFTYATDPIGVGLIASLAHDAEYAQSGGLVAYGPSLVGLHRKAAVFVDKILKGEKPADLPVEQPTRFSLVVNAKVAKALGLTFPPALLIRADEVIE
jgi:putative ABC transport system substrate-binding protein